MKQNLGAFIAALRKEKNMTQRELADRLNVSDKTISHWERSESSPDISLLPQLSSLLGVTVDELLQGEKRAVQPTVEHHYLPPKSDTLGDKASGFASKTLNKIKNKMTGDISERYRCFRMLSLVGTIIPCVVILIVTLVNLIGGYYFNSEMAFIPGIVTYIGSLWILAVSLGFTLGARLAFSKGAFPSPDANEEERKFIYKSNSFCFNNLFLVFCTLPMSLTGFQDILDFSVVLNVPITIVVLAVLWLVLTVILNKKGILKTEKQKMLTLKHISVFLFSAIFVSLSLVLFREAYFPSLERVSFDNPTDFIAYMETPKAKPDNAYLIDGVVASTFAPTMPAPGHTSHSDSPVSQLPPQDAENEISETVLYHLGTEIISFKWLNKEVCDVSYTSETDTFFAVTYEAKIKQKAMWTAVDDGVPIAISIFCAADAFICFILHSRKKRALSDGE